MNKIKYTINKMNKLKKIKSDQKLNGTTNQMPWEKVFQVI